MSNKKYEQSTKDHFSFPHLLNLTDPSTGIGEHRKVNPSFHYFEEFIDVPHFVNENAVDGDRKDFPDVSSIVIDSKTLQSAYSGQGILLRKEFCLIFNSFANPVASYGECARCCSSMIILVMNPIYLKYSTILALDF